MKLNRYTFNRWCSVLSCGVVAALLWVVLQALTTPVWEYASDALAAIPTPWLPLATCILLFALCWPAGHERWKAFLGVRHHIRYPPIWIAVIAALFTLTAPYVFDGSILVRLNRLLLQSEWWLEQSDPWAVVVIAACFVLYMLSRSLIAEESTAVTGKKQNAVESEHQVGSMNLDTYKGLLKWIETDEEIRHPDQDAFGYAQLAMRVARRLNEAVEYGKPPQSATILGRQGSGKSSLLSLVKHEIQENDQIHIVDISLWSYDNPDGAVAAVLDALVNAIRQHASTLSLTRMQKNYLDAMAQAGGSWGAFTHLLRSDDSPKQIVQRFEQIAKAIGVQFVLWLEDIERYTSEDMLDNLDACETRHVERMSAVYALLYLLDECKAITVVISTDSLSVRFDRQKVSRFIEHIPQITAEQVWPLIKIVRDKLLNDYAIDPATQHHREQLSMPDPEQEKAGHWVWFMQLDYDEPRIQFAVAHLLDTPRSLKTMLRLVLDAWDALKGEVDLDDLFVVNTIRASEPDVYALIQEHVERLRSGYPIARTPEMKKYPDYPGDQMDGLIDKIEKINPLRAVSIKTCIKYVFPRAFAEYDQKVEDNREYNNPQGLAGGGYWQRYLNSGLGPLEQSDQFILHLIKEWKDGA